MKIRRHHQTSYKRNETYGSIKSIYYNLIIEIESIFTIKKYLTKSIFTIKKYLTKNDLYFNYSQVKVVFSSNDAKNLRTSNEKKSYFYFSQFAKNIQVFNQQIN